jgi:hypothetical protein
MPRIAILGGTGPEGLGLALRFAQAGEAVTIGSRDPQRARQTAERVAAAVAGASVSSGTNDTVVADADPVVLAFPFAAAAAVLPPLAATLAGRIVIDVINPLRLRRGVFELLPVAEGSAAQLIQRLLPGGRVVAAFKTIAAEHLQQLDTPLAGDVLLCADDAGAKEAVASLAGRLPNLRPLDAGPLSSSHMVEGITALLLNLNRRYRAVTAVGIVGIGEG